MAVALDRFSDSLVKLGAPSREVGEWARGIVWEPAEDGFVYTSAEVSFVMADSGRHASPLLIGWTPQIWPVLATDWLEYGLIIKSDDLCQLLPQRDEYSYRPQTGEALWRAVAALGEVSADASVFLANEAQDGQAWEAQIEQRAPSVSTFDMALIPRLG